MKIASIGRSILALAVLSAGFTGVCVAGPDKNSEAALAAAAANPARSQAAVARDAARHPIQELTFFGIKPTMTVVELWPGGGYWTDILGPYLASGGRYYVALPVPGNTEDDAGSAKFKARIDAQKDRLGAIQLTELGADHFDIAPPGTADAVLTFRNLHNWMQDGYADAVFAGAFKALRPGGILGVEEHRGRHDKPQDPKAKDGYVRQDFTIAMAKKAGFQLVSSSEINANPRDTKDWPDGVWTLPPTLSQGETDRAKYVAIGEADNFVLKFRKPL